MEPVDQHLYRQIADRIEGLIDSGEFPVGRRLPGVHKLVVRFGVSDSVVRDAIKVLVARDRVRTVNRAGTYAQAPRRPRKRLPLGLVVRRNPLGYLFNAHSGRWPALEVPTRGMVFAPLDIAQALGLDEGDQVFARRRIVGPDVGEPAQITVTYLPVDLVDQAPILGEEDTGPGGYLEVIEQALKRGPVRWPAEVSTRLPTVEEARDLAMPEQQPVLVETRIVVDPLDELHPLAVDVAVRDGRRWSLTYELTRDASAAWPVTPATERNVVAYVPAPDDGEEASRARSTAATPDTAAEPTGSRPKV